MTEVVWDPLAKKVDDKTKISEEIDADLFTHNEDPSSHKQTGEAIDTHRVAEILDHLDASITEAKLAAGAVTPSRLSYNKFIIAPDWESLDQCSSWYGAHSIVSMHMGTINLLNQAYAGEYAHLESSGIYEGAYLAMKHPFFETVFYFATYDQFDFLCGMGDEGYRFAGFRIIDGTPYCFWVDNNGEHFYEIYVEELGSPHHYAVEVVSASVVKFYVDGELVYTGAAVFGFYGEVFPHFQFSLYNNNSTANEVRIFTTRFYQDL